MTLIRVYAVVYLLLVLGAVAALWRAGVLARLPLVWTFLVVAAALVLGILLPVAFAPRKLRE